MDISIKTLGENTQDVLLVVDVLTGVITYMNDSAKTFLGKKDCTTPVEIDNLLLPFDPKDRKKVENIFNGIKSGVEQNIDLRYVSGVGKKGWVRIRTYPCNQEMQHQYTIVMMSEVTHFKQASAKFQKEQQHLIQNDKLASLGTLIAGIAHEINNPLGYIKSNIHTLSNYLHEIIQAIEKVNRKKPIINILMGQLIIKDTPEIISETLEGLTRVEDIVTNLKCFARPADESLKVENANQLLDNALSIVWNELKHNCSITKNFTDTPYILCNKNQMIQVLVNLLLNARFAMKNRKGILTLSTYIGKATASISVKDNGHGISAAEKKKIFEPFFTTKPVGTGTGLGLSVVHSIIQKLNGKIMVESTPGEGTEFIISLPRHNQPKPIQTKNT